MLPVFVLCLLPSALAFLVALPRDGPVSPTGWPGLEYQAIRYEPICGNLGTGDRYSSPIDLAHYCGAAIEVFGNNTKDAIAFYDATGIRLDGAIVGNGIDICMCFALSALGPNPTKNALCIFVNGEGQADQWWSPTWDDMLAGNYRPGTDKSLPICADGNLTQMEQSWSATAVQPSITEKVSPVSAAAGGTSTEFYSYTTLTTTDAYGAPTTQTVAVAPGATNSPSTGLSRSDIIALGVGLGVGIPTILLMLIGLCKRR